MQGRLWPQSRIFALGNGGDSPVWFPPLGLCALCAPDGRDAPAPPWVILQLHPAPLACSATFSTCERLPGIHQNVGYWLSKRRKCPLAGGHGSDLQSRLLFALSMLGDLAHKSLALCPAMVAFGAAFLLLGVCTVTCITG